MTRISVSEVIQGALEHPRDTFFHPCSIVFHFRMIFAVEGHRSRTLQAEARKQFGHAEVHMRNEAARGQDVPLVEVLPHRALAEVLEAIVRKAIERRRLHQVHRRLRNQHLTPRRSQNSLGPGRERALLLAACIPQPRSAWTLTTSSPA